jgi:hypothetical protein
MIFQLDSTVILVCPAALPDHELTREMLERFYVVLPPAMKPRAVQTPPEKGDRP